MNSVKILQRMKENLMERGWLQGALVNECGNVCLSGSMMTLPEYKDEIRETQAATEAVLAINQQIVCSIPDWNDAPGRTFNDVIDLLDGLIISEKERLGL